MILPSDFNLKILIAVTIAMEKLIRINRTLIEIFQADFTLNFCNYSAGPVSASRCEWISLKCADKRYENRPVIFLNR